MKPILYTQKTCGMCKTVHMLLEKKGIDFDSVDVNESNIASLKESVGLTMTPTLIVGDERLQGAQIVKWANQRGHGDGR